MAERQFKLFHHLTITDRLKIERMYNGGAKTQEIADALRVNYTTIYRELKRPGVIYEHLRSDWTTEMRYSAERAQQQYEERMQAKGRPIKLGHDYEWAKYVETKIADEGRSPAAVLMDMELEEKRFETTVCVTTIYNYIHNRVFLRVTSEKLPRHGKQYHPYRRVKPARAPKGESIEKRPACINDRSGPFHWEGDTVKGKARDRECVLTLIERTSRNYICKKLESCTAESINRALDDLEREYGPERFRQIFRSITVDNGSEFSNCEGMEHSADGSRRTKIYYCHPYSSFEKGSNENHNGMFRRRFPKGISFSDVTQKEIDAAADWMNNYPRKKLGRTTPARVFAAQLASLE